MKREIKIFFEEQIYGYVFLLRIRELYRWYRYKFIVIDYRFGKQMFVLDTIILVAISQLLENQKKKFVNEKYDNFVQLFFSY